MNDLDMVRDLRSEVRQSEANDLHRARRRLLATVAPEPPARRVRRTVLRVAAMGALGVTITAGVTMVQSLGTNDRGNGIASAPAWLSVANAETLAKHATAAAADQTDVYPRADQWIYAKWDSYTSPKLMPEAAVPPVGGGKTGSRKTVETWIRGDGEERAMRDEVSKTIKRRRDGADPRLRFDPAYLRSLPLEPSALLERLKKDTSEIPLPEARAVSHQIMSILEEGAPAARLRAALYTVLSRLDDVGVETVRDLLGRQGVAIYTHDDEGVRQEVIIDPNTFVLLGARRIYVGGVKAPSPYYSGLPKGEVIASRARVSVGIVDDAGDIP
ncbi:CU044_5270 family protein [Streptosporangium sp. NPDC048047]|uniref:CU044_5270 family protein n=1 Tax=Streptosporangium sp. NPDC048047 TaxID=3155748 RepID=UPI00342EBF3F